MRMYLLSFILIVAALGVESVSDEQGEEELYVYDDYENLVKLEYNESDASGPWPTDLDVTDDVKFYINSMTEESEENFDPNKETVFVTHGWKNSKINSACTNIRDALLKRGEYNIIIIDWSAISIKPYPIAARRVWSVGKTVAKKIDKLGTKGMKFNETTLVGHSLGAHVMGIAGYHSKQKVNYVVGLDPALPLFSSKGAGERISTKDAKYVEIIHTNAGRLGFVDKIGQADFYPNGGRKQPHCLSTACSHARSYKYFAESLVTTMGFWSKQCEGSEIHPQKCNGPLGLMGDLKRDLSEKGGYYLRTNHKKPYALGKP